MVLDGVVLGGQSEGIPADGVQHVIALQAALSCHNVQADIGPGVPNVQARARGVWELYKRVELLLLTAVFGVENAPFLPLFLPFGFDGPVVVFHFASSFQIKLKTPDAQLKRPGRKFRGTTRDLRARSRVPPHSLQQGLAYNAATRPRPTKRRLWVGRLGDQYARRACCLLAPTAGSLKSGPGAFFPSQSLGIFL